MTVRISAVIVRNGFLDGRGAPRQTCDRTIIEQGQLTHCEFKWTGISSDGQLLRYERAPA